MQHVLLYSMFYDNFVQTVLACSTKAWDKTCLAMFCSSSNLIKGNELTCLAGHMPMVGTHEARQRPAGGSQITRPAAILRFFLHNFGSSHVLLRAPVPSRPRDDQMASVTSLARSAG